MGQRTLRISTNETAQEMVITLEGRIAGPWVDELRRVWVETAPRIASRKLLIDLRNVTYADDRGKQVLKEVYAQGETDLVVSTPWTQYLAETIRNSSADHAKEAENGNHP